MIRHAPSSIYWWLKGLLLIRGGRLIGTAAGAAITIALIMAFGVFLLRSEASMTARAVQTVPVDWQIELVPGADETAVQAALDAATKVNSRETAGYAQIDALEATTGGSTQTTGAGKVIGISPSYAQTFPGQLRLLQGNAEGALVAQQTAANLHVALGDTVAIHRPGLAPVSVTVSGIVELPNADAMFQAIGVPKGAAPQAPPDNVLVLPIDQWQPFFAPQAAKRPDSVRTQIHISMAHDTLPNNPLDAFTSVTIAGHNLELRVAGQAILGNNLAARLDAARADALYARILFLFLGAPGIILACLLTIAVAGSGEAARRRDQAILRLRGASRSTMLLFAGAEAVFVWLTGAIGGVIVAEFASQTLLGGSAFSRQALPIAGGAVLAGLILSLGAILLPAWIDARSLTVAGARQLIGPSRKPIWRRIHLDLLLMVMACLVFWRTAASGYQVVLAPEGVPATSIDYWSFLAPVLLWIGIALLTIRLTSLITGLRPLIALLSRPIAGSLSTAVAASLSRQTRRLATGVGLTALAFAFATSTAIFNTNYQRQALVDAQLTNGADVTVTGTTMTPAEVVKDKVASLPGVAAIQPMQHRFAYVGADLQDIYGIDPVAIGNATSISDAYFGNHDAAASLAALAKTPDGVLVSQETVNDFQLSIGDTINLRLKEEKTNSFVTVPFTFIGVVREFPTAPLDSFLVANASYLAKATGSAASEVLLVRSKGGDPAVLRNTVETAAAGHAALHVKDVTQAAHLIGSSLTAVSLGGLSELELSFAVLAIVASAGLVLALGLADRRRSFAILTLLGATARQTAAFLWVEGAMVFGLGAVIGIGAGTLIAWMLITVLQGVFDPPPDVIAMPWGYLALTIAAALAATATAIELARHDAVSKPIMTIKETR